jgi:hypothetical protein
MRFKQASRVTESKSCGDCALSISLSFGCLDGFTPLTVFAITEASASRSTFAFVMRRLP